MAVQAALLDGCVHVVVLAESELEPALVMGRDLYLHLDFLRLQSQKQEPCLLCDPDVVNGIISMHIGHTGHTTWSQQRRVPTGFKPTYLPSKHDALN